MSKTILKVKNLKVKLGEEEIIRNLSFEVKEGEFLVFLGPNGAGKSTLMRAILGLIPFEGEVVWLRKLKISYLPERLSREKFRKSLVSVEEFFKFKRVSRERIVAILAAVGLEPDKVVGRNVGSLSAGQFQRLLIAWSLVSEPEVLFFDEPETGIDLGGEETVYSLLERFWREKKLTVFLITHDLNIVYRYATNILCLNKNQVYCFGPPREILTPQVLEKVYGTQIKFYEHEH